MDYKNKKNLKFYLYYIYCVKAGLDIDSLCIERALENYYKVLLYLTKNHYFLSCDLYNIIKIEYKTYIYYERNSM